MALDPARVIQMVESARDALTVQRVYGEPIERDGVLIIPAAAVRGGGGAGGGSAPDESAGSGGGYGVHARPVGAFVVRDGEVHWEAALDLNKVILGGQLLGLAAILAVRAFLKHRRRA